MDRVSKLFNNVAFKSKINSKSLRCRLFEPSLKPGLKSLQIWPPVYEPSWMYYQMHQTNYWSASEHDPLDDKVGFLQIDEGWQNAILQSFALLAIGDDKVMNIIEDDNLDWFESTKWMFADQAARETVHKIAYNRMLTLASCSKRFTVDDLTSDAYVDYVTGDTDVFNFECADTNVARKALFLIKMMLCERYLFSAPFLIINMMGETGLINTSVKINMQVMKDEHVHYLHAVHLLKDLKKANDDIRIEIDGMFCKMAEMFKVMVENIVEKIGASLDEHCVGGIMDHTRFTLRTIFVDNEIDPMPDIDEYDTTPFSVFDKNSGIDKFNLMESTSTVYKAVKSIYVPDWNAMQNKINDC